MTMGGVFLQMEAKFVTDSTARKTGLGHCAAPRRENLGKYLIRHRWMYLFMLPGVVFLFIFNYVPIYGIIIAFKDFKFNHGIFGSKWVGMSHFAYLFGSTDFWNVLRNSVSMSFLRLVWGMPAPILMALMLNEVRQTKIKRTVQTIVYLPHFISWVVLAGMIHNFVSPSGGLINRVIEMFGGRSIAFLQNPKYFRSILIIAEIYKECGWGTIIYLAAMTGIDPEIYEAAIIDRATRLQRIWYITLPGILHTVVALLILRMGSVLRNGFEQIYLLQTPLVYSVSDVFETYTYRVGLQQGRYSYAAAVGLFQSAVGFLMIYVSNTLSRKLSDSSLW